MRDNVKLLRSRAKNRNGIIILFWGKLVSRLVVTDSYQVPQAAEACPWPARQGQMR